MIIKGWNGSRKQKYRVSSRLWYSVPHRASLASFLFLICVTYIKSWTHLPPPISVNSERFSVRPRALILSFITYYHNTELAFRVVLTTLTNLALKSLLKVYVCLQYTSSIEKGCWSEKIELNNVCRFEETGHRCCCLLAIIIQWVMKQQNKINKKNRNAFYLVIAILFCGQGVSKTKIEGMEYYYFIVLI